MWILDYEGKFSINTIESFCRKHYHVTGCPRKCDFHNKYQPENVVRGFCMKFEHQISEGTWDRMALLFYCTTLNFERKFPKTGTLRWHYRVTWSIPTNGSTPKFSVVLLVNRRWLVSQSDWSICDWPRRKSTKSDINQLVDVCVTSRDAFRSMVCRRKYLVDY